MSNSVTRSRRVRRTLLALLPLAPFAALATDADFAEHSHTAASGVLLANVRAHTARYLDVNAATGDGFVRATPCVSGPDFGAMGVHFIRLDRLNSIDQPKDSKPTALIYEPTASGGLRLVGVEFIVMAGPWDTAHPKSPPTLDGNLFNLVGAPNRFGLDAFYELHAWAWQANPTGNFADWNTRVVCDHQPAGG